jgi:hypothetical protein
MSSIAALKAASLRATRLLNVFENVFQPVVRDGLRNREARVLLHEVVYPVCFSARPFADAQNH